MIKLIVRYNMPYSHAVIYDVHYHSGKYRCYAESELPQTAREFLTRSTRREMRETYLDPAATIFYA